MSRCFLVILVCFVTVLNMSTVTYTYPYYDNSSHFAGQFKQEFENIFFSLKFKSQAVLKTYLNKRNRSNISRTKDITFNICMEILDITFNICMENFRDFTKYVFKNLVFKRT